MKLRKYRELKGLTIEAAAAEIGVSDVAFGYWERGRSIPDEANMAAIAKWSNGAVMPNDFYLVAHTAK
ncbi:MAG TPA: helix-turn-helix transcriptional regulator [Terriglobales bacterium]|nr:helix-turn-helix transcriptional regulator [Terriglobales bacterium]